jgi:hypothetical protein
MPKRKPAHRESFAATVRQVQETIESSGKTAIAWPNPIRDGRWTDSGGVVWLLRGDAEPKVKQIERLLLNADVRVLWVHGPEPSEISLAERPAFWERARPYVLGKVKRSRNDYTDYSFGEFRDEAGRHLLVVQQYC